MSIDAIGNFLTIIRNGLMASKPFIVAPYSGMRLAIAKILKEEGFIKDYLVVDQEQEKKVIKIVLKYVNGESVIHEITRVSTPGRRHYVGINEIKPVIGGLGISILTTNRGVITNKKAKSLVVGGEILCTVW
jgi:small subunit ribosomal protein S8